MSETEREMLERHLREIGQLVGGAVMMATSAPEDRERERIEFRLRQLDAEEAPKTVVENERVSLPVVRECETCKHEALSASLVPCRTCCLEFGYPRWEPKETADQAEEVSRG